MSRFFIPAIALVIAVLACNREPAPLQGLSGITRVQIRTYGPQLPSSTFVLTDPLRLNAITQALDTEPPGWHGSDWETPPAGDLSVEFFRADSLVGVLWVGQEFLAERGAGPRLLKNISPQREAQIRHLLDPHLVPSSLQAKPS